jgi:hypothetical protein
MEITRAVLLSAVLTALPGRERPTMKGQRLATPPSLLSRIISRAGSTNRSLLSLNTN